MTIRWLLAAISLSGFALAAPTRAQDALDMEAAPSITQFDKDFVAYAQSKILFINATLLDGTGAPAKSHMDVFVQDGKIVSLIERRGPRNQMLMSDIKVIDLAGKTLLPGFAMVHEHMFYPTGPGVYGAMLTSFPALYLAGGTTTARTGGSMSPYADLNMKRAIDSGVVPGPDLDVTGPYLNGPGLPIYQMHALTGAPDAVKTINYWADEGATSFKAYTNITREELKAAIATAHARGTKITGHLCSVTYREAAELGIDNLEHGFAVMTDFVKDKQPDSCPAREDLLKSLAELDVDGVGAMALIKLLVAHRVALTSTLTVFETFTPGRPMAHEGARALLIPELRKAYEDKWADIQHNDKYRPYAAVFPKLMKLERMFVAAGGTLLAGTDPTGYGGVVPGFAGAREIELLQEAGFSPRAAIEIATLNGARYLGRDNGIGSIEVGKRADLVVLDGDLTSDPRALDHVALVFKNGVGYKSDAILKAFAGQVGLY